MTAHIPWLFRLLICALPLAGWVPQTRYEEARSAARIEQEAHRRTQAVLTDVARKLDKTQADLSERELRLEKMAQEIDEAKLNVDVANTDKQNALALVETLQSDLGRTG